MIKYLRTLLISSLLPVLSATANAAEHRLITTDANATNLVVSLGLIEQLVAIDVTSRLPAGAESLPNIGYHRTLSAEGLLSLNPTTVLGSNHMGPPETVAALKQSGVQLLQLADAKSTAQLRSNIEQAALALDEQPRGKAVLTQLDTLEAQLNKFPLSEHKIAFLLAMDSTKLRLAGKGTAGHALIEALSADNVANYDNYRNVSAESLLTMAPTIILVAGRQQQTAVADLLAANSIVQHTPAGRQQQIFAVDSGALVAGLSLAAIEEARRIQTLVVEAQ
ncbi:ABC transporter substrate-binding protein [Neiella marina]|uniref:ABC transporter substrate-binding protein n=1 Tax=Neiella holothuriorum TaxID=2870530 RepID=A0ABS7EGY7_9GAMM|nr:ABC transporter substrate-binding protein [Neiella holothuriorum]MBW8191590.1 ABC transporter substrate-binding protein [Neiella holothuriorum]